MTNYLLFGLQTVAVVAGLVVAHYDFEPPTPPVQPMQPDLLLLAEGYTSDPTLPEGHPGNTQRSQGTGTRKRPVITSLPE